MQDFEMIVQTSVYFEKITTQTELVASPPDNS